MKRTFLIIAALALLLPLQAAKKAKQPQQTDREYWCSLAYKMAQPVLENMAKGELQKNMKTEFSPSFDNRDRRVVYMETFGRLMAGIAPWLTLPDDDTAEGQQRRQLLPTRMPLTLIRPTISCGEKRGRRLSMPPISPRVSSVASMLCGNHSMNRPNSAISMNSSVCAE